MTDIHYIAFGNFQRFLPNQKFEEIIGNSRGDEPVAEHTIRRKKQRSLETEIPDQAGQGSGVDQQFILIPFLLYFCKQVREHLPAVGIGKSVEQDFQGQSEDRTAQALSNQLPDDRHKFLHMRDDMGNGDKKTGRLQDPCYFRNGFRKEIESIGTEDEIKAYRSEFFPKKFFRKEEPTVVS